MAEPLNLFEFLDARDRIEGRTPLSAAAPTPDSSASTPVAARAPQIPVENVRGDDLIAKAVTLTQPRDEETAAAREFWKSQQIVQGRLENDVEFARNLIPKLDKLAGEQLVNAINEAALDIEIEERKRTDPKFNEYKAAATGFLNGATFGQMSRIRGYVGELIDGRPAQEVIEEQAHEAKLLQRAFPKSNIAGEALSFMVPGSPARALFGAASRVGTKVAARMLGRIATDARYAQKLTKAVVEGSAATATGSAAIGGVQGFLGRGEDAPFQLDRAADQAAAFAIGGGLMGALIPIGGAALAPVARSAARGVGNLVTGKADIVARVAEGISGVPREALRAARKDPEGLRRAAGSEAQIGDDFVDFLQSEFGALPEVQAAKSLLPQMGRVDISPILKILKRVGRTIDPQQDSQITGLGEWANRIHAMAGKDGKVSAEQMWEIKETLQGSSRVAFGESQGILATALKSASRQARLSLEAQAESLSLTSDGGRTYVQLMRRAVQKRRVLKFFEKKLGKNIETQADKAEALFTGLFGKNKTYQQARMEQLDSLYGTDFLGRARTANLAKQVGPGGELPLLPAQTTGRSQLGSRLFQAVGTGAGATIGTIASGPVGGAIGAAVGAGVAGLGALASSPRVAARVVGASDSISGFVGAMFKNPEALAKLAGVRGGATAASARGPRSQLKVPEDIRHIAREIHDEYLKNGPMSAAGVVRLVADTPMFAGLVHFYEIADRDRRMAEARKMLDQVSGQNAVGVAR